MSKSPHRVERQRTWEAAFGVGPRFVSKTEPSATLPCYVGFASFLDAARGRAVSPAGTFSSGPRSTIATPGPARDAFYSTSAADIVHALPWSHGVRRTAPRFQTYEEDCSPGPIYYPPAQHKVKVYSWHQATQRPKQLKEDGPVVQHTPLALPEKDLKENTKQKKKVEKAVCYFGGRYEPHPTPGEGATLLLERKTFVEELNDKYIGVFPRATRAKNAIEVLPGPGHFLKNEFVSVAPKWSFGRRLRPASQGTPGPGAYAVEKYHPTSKPKCATFARVAHNFTSEKGKDSPGPSLYSKMQSWSPPKLVPRKKVEISSIIQSTASPFVGRESRTF